MKQFAAVALAAAILGAQQTPTLPAIRGFSQRQSERQHELERKARQVPDPTRAQAYMKRMAAEPHHAGSLASKGVAEYALGLFKEWGYDAKIEEFEALLPYPTVRIVEMTAPVRYRASLQEPIMKEDQDSGDRNQLPLYNAYSASGDVTGELVYVNYGVPDDYKQLKKMGIDVKGKIVIARYGGSWRGTKPKVAAENGAIGCLIYSDPKDDGFYQGDVFPRGPYRPQASAQRGSVMDMPLYVGDPLSPGWASEKGGKKLSRSEAQSIMKIPVLPLSWADAKPLLDQLGGEMAPAEWRGAVPVTYHMGPGPAKVRIKVDFDWTSKPLYNVIARMKGETLPDEWVIYGNHHDAWVNGASDPVSGAVALLESARALSELRKGGWKPRRGIVFALWDAEEFGLIGSTEWVEKHRAELERKTVAYLNSDTNNGGRFSAGGSHVLEQFLREVLRDIDDPGKGKSLLAIAETEEGETARRRPQKGFALGALGAGSDYVPFVHHAGIPSLNLGFSKPGGAGTYHSIYDSYAWFTKTMDRDFVYSRALAQVMATSILRLSEAPLMPHDFRPVVRVISEYHNDLRAQHKDNKLDMTPLLRELESLKAAADKYDGVQRGMAGRLEGAPAERVARVNQMLLNAERALTRAQGLPARSWYKHHLYAPGIYTGYSARTLPGVREAADQGRYAEANQQAQVLAELIRNLTALVDRAASALADI